MSMQKNLLKSGGDKRRNETKKEAGNIGYRRKRKYFKMRNEEKKERLSSLGWFMEKRKRKDRKRKDRKKKGQKKKGQAQRLTKLIDLGGKERTGAAIDEIDRFGII